MIKKSPYLRDPVVPFRIKSGENVSQVLKRMEDISFQGRNLGISVEIWLQMLKDRVVIFFGLAGAMVPAGMRALVAELIRRRLVDCIVSTGANIFHDVHEIIGRRHYKGNPHADDIELLRGRVDRIYDTYASEDEFVRTDYFVSEFAETLEERPYSTREFLYQLGKHLSKKGKKEGILTSAAQAGVPIYCPAIGDSSIGMAMAYLKSSRGREICFDTVRDVLETSQICQWARRSGVIYIGGGTPKNFIQQAEITSDLSGNRIGGHIYALQITQDSPQWGGLSGCTLKEAQSWGKVAPDAQRLTLHCDATIALPLISTAVVERVQEERLVRQLPRFDVSKRDLQYRWDGKVKASRKKTPKR